MHIVATPSLAPKSIQNYGSYQQLIAFYWSTRVIYFSPPWHKNYEDLLFDEYNVMQFSNDLFLSKKELEQQSEIEAF